MQLHHVLLLALPGTALANLLVEERGFYCPENRTFANGRSCRVTCFYDRPGGDYARRKTNSGQDCFDLCGLDANCVTAQYKKSNGYCYFKHSTHKLVYDNNIDTADCSVDPVTTTKSTTTTASVTTPATPLPTTCDTAQSVYCYDDLKLSRCDCALNANHSNATCYNTLQCNSCTSDADCSAGYHCAYDYVDACQKGSVTLTCLGTQPRGKKCNPSPPIRSIDGGS